MARKSSYKLLKKLAINSSSVTGAAAFLSAQQNSDIGSFYDADVKINEAIALGDSTKIVDALVINNSIVPQSNISQIQKSLNEVYFKYLSSESSLTSVDFNTLQSIAQLCPFEDGTSVYQARTLLSRYDTVQYVNSCEFVDTPPNSQRIGVKASESRMVESSLNVYPNPSYGEITVECNIEGAHLLIYNIVGELVFEGILTAQTANLNLSDLKAGTYLLKITKDKRIIKADKLLIAK